MKVKVGEVIYDEEEQPIMVVLTDKDKENIANMAPGCTKYCAYPDEGYAPKWVEEWMERR